jgi:hypothetical protein
MKPLLPLTLLALLLAAAAWGAVSRAPRIYVNGLPAFAKAAAGKPLRQEVIVKDGVTYVPLRAVAESLGCTVDGACPERARGDPKARPPPARLNRLGRSGVFIWGGQHSPHIPGLPSDGASAPSRRSRQSRAGRDRRCRSFR